MYKTFQCTVTWSSAWFLNAHLCCRTNHAPELKRQLKGMQFVPNWCIDRVGKKFADYVCSIIPIQGDTLSPAQEELECMEAACMATLVASSGMRRLQLCMAKKKPDTSARSTNGTKGRCADTDSMSDRMCTRSVPEHFLPIWLHPMYMHKEQCTSIQLCS